MDTFDLKFYQNKRVFVTGHTGFKGAWLCKILVEAGASVTGYSLTPPTEPNLFSLAGIEDQMVSVIGDVRDRDSLMKAFQYARPEIVFHLAAQPIVRAGYQEPAYTYETNIMGTVNVLECVRAATAAVKSVVIVTTDKVYENKNWPWGYRENDSLDGYDPYSNSKSCADLITQSYIRSFFCESEAAVSTLRAGNVIGGGDFARDRVIPDCVRAAQAGKPIEVRNPQSIRPYQHVLEALFAYLIVGQGQYKDRSLAGCYNVGPDDRDCVTTKRLVELFCHNWGEGMNWLDRAEPNAPHEDNYLKLDCSKLKSVFGWSPRWDVQKAVEQTVRWTKNWLDGGSVPAEMDRQIGEYIRE